MKLSKNRINSNQKGIIHHLTLFIVLAIVLIGVSFAGWKVWDNNKSAKAAGIGDITSGSKNGFSIYVCKSFSGTADRPSYRAKYTIKNRSPYSASGTIVTNTSTATFSLAKGASTTRTTPVFRVYGSLPTYSNRINWKLSSGESLNSSGTMYWTTIGTCSQ